jgi:metal-responsive CopG/Arc/MetJ family transcriptional regulator
MVGLSRETRLQIMLDQDELAAIDDWRFKRRMPSRASAIRDLLRRGLQAELGAATDNSMRSEDFGVLNGEARSKS